MTRHLGDFAAGVTVRGSFNSRTAAGAAITLGGTPVLSVWKDNGTTQTVAGVTLTVDFDSTTGLHVYEIVTTDAFYTSGSDYMVAINQGTVDSVDVIGTVVGTFSIENRSVAKLQKSAFLGTELAIGDASDQDALVITGGPTNNIANVLAIIFDDSDAAARIVLTGSYTYAAATGTFVPDTTPSITVTTSDKITLVAVTAASTDVNVTQISGDSTAADNLEAAFDGTGYNVGNGQVVAASVTGNVGGNVVGQIGGVASGGIAAGSFSADAITAAALAADAVTEIQSGLATEANLATVAGYLDTEIAASLAILNKLDTALEDDGSSGFQFTTLALENGAGGGGGSDWTADEKTAIRSILGIPGSGTTPADPSVGILDTIRDGVTALPTAAVIADAVWDEATSGHATSGSYGASVLIIGVPYTHTGVLGTTSATVSRT